MEFDGGEADGTWTWMRAVTGNAIPASLVVQMISYLIARLVKMSPFIFFSPLTLSQRFHLNSPTDAALLQCVWRRGRFSPQAARYP